MDVGHTRGDAQAQNTADFVSRIHVKTEGFPTITGTIVLARIGAFPVKIELGGVFILGIKVEKGVLGLKPGKEELEVDQRSQLKRPPKGGPISQLLIEQIASTVA